MSVARKHAIVSGAAWLVVTVAFAVILAKMGVEAFTADTGERTRNAVATVIVPGYLVNFALIWRSRRARRRGDIDERDQAVERRATELTALILLLAVFLCCIALFEAYADAGAVPVGWLWILAYGTIAVVSLLHPVLTLILDFSGKIGA